MASTESGSVMLTILWTMTAHSYKENHYVPRWYQQRFLPACGQRVFRYLDLTPEQFRDSNGVLRTKTAIRKWGAPSCFKETDLYTVKYGNFESTDIEQFFFGKVDESGKRAVEFFSTYNAFDDVRTDPSPFLQALLNYMSVQRFRTPKGLKYLSTFLHTEDKNRLLIEMQRLQNMHCAIWTECVWALVDATTTATKFLISDHPVTLYNREIFPDSLFCRRVTDPDFRMNGTHTLFPLSPTRILILTHLSWVRNPYGKAQKLRPNPSMFRPAMFNFTGIHVGRELDETEVRQINFIIKRRARRYVAAVREEWLYPEDKIPSTHWRKLDDRYLLMPDPRSEVLGGSMVIGYKDGSSEAFDEYGRHPGQQGYSGGGEPSKESRRELSADSRTLYGFQGEFARLFGSKRRGTSFRFGRTLRSEDDESFHQYHLDMEKRYTPTGLRPRRDKRAV
jgi:hypothetical protein